MASCPLEANEERGDHFSRLGEILFAQGARRDAVCHTGLGLSSRRRVIRIAEAKAGAELAC